MISLNTPIGGGDGELLDLFGVEADPSTAPTHADELAAVLRRLQPLERSLLLSVHSGSLTVEEAAQRLGVTTLAVTRRLRAAERKARRHRKPKRAGTPCPGAGVEVPVGTVRVRRCRGSKGNAAARYIKVRMDGPAHRRWKRYARHWWETHRGRVPPGKRVIHLNGNMLDDSPDNLALGDPADVAYLWAQRGNVQRRRMDVVARGSARHNRERRLARDLAGELRATYWYAVDHVARTIIGPCGRSLRHAYEYLEVPVPPMGADNSPQPWLSAQLGWPGIPSCSALVLAVLADNPGRVLTRSEIAVRLEALSLTLGRPVQANAGYLRQAMYEARRRGLLTSTRHGRGGLSTHQITPQALAQRGPVCRLAVLRGAECRVLQEEGYAVRPAAARV